MIDGERFIDAAEDGHLHESNHEFMKRSRQVHLELAERYEWTVVPLQEGVEKMNEVLWELLQLHLS